jgi:hypothetical protein
VKAFLIALSVSCAVATAQPGPKSMTKIVLQLQSPDVPADSFGAKPKTMYRSGTQYCRIEEEPDPSRGIHGLSIINEPDAWLINLADRTAQHIVDPGPTFNCRLPVFSNLAGGGLPEDEIKPILTLEFGLEEEFFKAKGATPRPGGVQQGQQTTAYVARIGESSLALFTFGTPERPLSVAWTRGEKHEIFWYSGYGQVAFDPKLFAKPEGVKIQDAK